MSNESFVRWQGITITQLGYAVNLIIGLTVATLGFSLSRLSDEKFILDGYGNWVFLISIICLLVSGGLGISCVINRLHDFRATAQISKNKENNSSKENIEGQRNLCQKLGARTWMFFKVQIVLFALGVVSMVIAVLLAYNNKPLGLAY